MNQYEITDNLIKNTIFYTLNQTSNNTPYTIKNVLKDRNMILYSQDNFPEFKYYYSYIFCYCVTIIILCFLYQNKIENYVSFAVFYLLQLYCGYHYFNSYQENTNTKYEIEECIHNKVCKVPIIRAIKFYNNKVYIKNIEYTTFETELEHYNINWKKPCVIHIYTMYYSNIKKIKDQIKGFDKSFVKDSLSVFLYHPVNYSFDNRIFLIFLLGPFYDLYCYSYYQKINIQILKNIY